MADKNGFGGSDYIFEGTGASGNGVGSDLRSVRTASSDDAGERNNSDPNSPTTFGGRRGI
jgi:hypothetical protein